MPTAPSGHLVLPGPPEQLELTWSPSIHLQACRQEPWEQPVQLPQKLPVSPLHQRCRLLQQQCPVPVPFQVPTEPVQVLLELRLLQVPTAPSGHLVLPGHPERLEPTWSPSIHLQACQRELREQRQPLPHS